MHEFPEGGFVSGYQVDYRTRKRLAYEYFDEFGKFEKKFFPSLPYGNPQIGFTHAFKNREVFVSGVGETDKGNRRFSYCFDSSGVINWSFNDSLFVLIIFEETDTNYFAQLYSSRDTGLLVRGNNLVRINRAGQIIWSKPFTNLYNQTLPDSLRHNQIRSIEKTNKKYIFHLMSNRSAEYHKIAVFDENFKLQFEIKTRLTDYIITNTNGIVVNENLGSINLPSLKIRSFDWNQKVHWEFFEGKDSLTQIASRLFSSNTTVSYLSHHKDSAYKWLDERFNMYNLDGTKKRVCRYSFLSTHGISLIASTKDNGFVARAKSILWGDTKLGFVKTDSLGLVYNTDIICDCKDFKVEVSEVKVPELNVQVFPNPATDKINVLLSHKQEATITLHNLNGQVVKTQAAEFNSNIFDISELDKGLYFVEVISQNSKIIKKLIVE